MIQSKFKSIVLLIVTSVFLATSAGARTIDLQVNLGTPVMEAGKNQKTFLKIGLRGFELPGEFDRAPVNMAIVLDRSGRVMPSAPKRVSGPQLVPPDSIIGGVISKVPIPDRLIICGFVCG